MVVNCQCRSRPYMGMSPCRAFDSIKSTPTPTVAQGQGVRVYGFGQLFTALFEGHRAFWAGVCVPWQAPIKALTRLLSGST